MVRRAEPAEAAAIAALLNADAAARYGEADLTAAAVKDWFGLDDVELLVVAGEDRLVAYGDVQRSPDRSKLWLDVHEHPAHPGAAAPLWPELERAGGRGASARAILSSRDESLRRQVEERGYRPLRSSFRMAIELDGVPPEVELPAGIAVRPMRPGEEGRVHEAHMAAFADHWDFEPHPYGRWAQFSLGEGFDPSLWFLAEAGDELAGIAICRMHQSGDPRRGWVGVLGVLPAHRRRGLGEALLRHSFGAFAARGCDRVELGVDAENTTGAVKLYERAGMHVSRRYDTYERRL
ncbi:MAG TPA: GNAT family N-acetyltransferase [Gaiellaceae bacterium]|nr:GNAT family N-acetyltransferase [Gaiellaceae bacterium]